MTPPGESKIIGHSDSFCRPWNIKLIKFNELNVGERAKIRGFSASDRAYRQKLMAMGLTRGSEFSIERIAPLGDPVEIEVRGTRFCLRKQEADILQCEKITH